MNIEALQALAQHDEVPGIAPIAPIAPSRADGVRGADSAFGQIVSEGLHKLNDQLKLSQSDLQSLALGETRNLHEVMVRLEESRIAFQLMLQTRNRVLEAYQEVMRMQV